jgi:predicted regulator of Ras-like GTPase activity (Roadblock/LC7/MglB family)
MPDASNRSQRLDRAIADLLQQAPEVEAAAVVSFDGLPMASALPATMDEDRVAAMSAALLSLGERAAEGLGRGGLNQVYIEGESGTVFLVSADDEAVLVAVAAKGAKAGMMLYEVRRAAAAVADALRTGVEHETYPEPPRVEVPLEVVPDPPLLQAVAAPVAEPVLDPYVAPIAEVVAEPEPVVPYAASATDPAWVAHLPNGAPAAATDPQSWS